MTDAAPSDQPQIEHAEVVGEEEHGDAVTSPAKVMRIGTMVKTLLEEVRMAPLDEPSRERLAEIYERSIAELSEALSPDLQHELKMLALPFRDGEVPSEGEIRVAKAQLVGWLEGLFHGIQATLFAQQLAARQQLEQIRQLPPGSMQGDAAGMPGMPPQPDRPGTYLWSELGGIPATRRSGRHPCQSPFWAGSVTTAVTEAAQFAVWQGSRPVRSRSRTPASRRSGRDP
jgi:Bacterial proteasome activator